MIYIIKLIRLLLRSSISFSDPPENSIVIFDDESLGDFTNVLKKRKFFILKVRQHKINKIYINFKIIKKMIKYYRKNIFSSYLLSLIDLVNPKIILTTIDNSFKFHELAKILNKEGKTCIAVQNAARYDFQRNELLFKKKLSSTNDNKKFFIPHYYCFGEREVKDCKKFKIKVLKFHKFGSLRLSNYLHYIKTKKIKINNNKYDIALISEGSGSRNKLWNQKGIDEGFIQVTKFAINFSIKNKLKLIFIIKRSRGKLGEIELEYYKKFLSQRDFTYLTKNLIKVKRYKYNSYSLIHESRVAIGVCSTMLRDKISLNGKILACNNTKLNLYNFPISGICSINNASYNNFSKRLKKILRMNNKEFFKEIKNKRLVNTDKHNFTFTYLNQHLDEILL